MSPRSISVLLAMTAAISQARRNKLSALYNLQTELMDDIYSVHHEDEYAHEPLEHNPYVDEYTVGYDHHSAMDHVEHGLAEHTAYYDQHHYDPDSHHFDVEHNPYVATNDYPMDYEQPEAYGYEGYPYEAH